MHNGFANRCLTAWLSGRICYHFLILSNIFLL